MSAGILPALREALSVAFWYKPDLRRHLNACLPGQRALIAELDWSDYKRNVVAQLVDTLYNDQHKYFDDLVSLMLNTADLSDPAHLKRLDDGPEKYAAAVAALHALRAELEPYRQMRTEDEAAARRRADDRRRAEDHQAVAARLDAMRAEFLEIVQQAPQRRGYLLEKFLNSLFELYDIDAKGPFRVKGEQLDGAFTLDATEFLLEAKWRDEKTPPADLDAFAGKIGRRLDNTLGLFVSMNGFQPTAVELHSQGRPVMILMDGGDLNAVVEGRIDLPRLIGRKRQHAARTGGIYLSAYQIL